MTEDGAEFRRRSCRRPGAPNDPLRELTEREQEVLALMAEGRSNHGIGQKLFLSATLSTPGTDAEPSTAFPVTNAELEQMR